MPCSMQLDKERNATSTPECQTGVRVVRRHNLLVRCSAPLRLLVPVKLGLKNVKAITRITYTAEEPKDYWAKRGYSHYDGI